MNGCFLFFIFRMWYFGAKVHIREILVTCPHLNRRIPKSPPVFTRVFWGRSAEICTTILPYRQNSKTTVIVCVGNCPPPRPTNRHKCCFWAYPQSCIPSLGYLNALTSTLWLSLSLSSLDYLNVLTLTLCCATVTKMMHPHFGRTPLPRNDAPTLFIPSETAPKRFCTILSVFVDST